MRLPIKWTGRLLLCSPFNLLAYIPLCFALRLRQTPVVPRDCFGAAAAELADAGSRSSTIGSSRPVLIQRLCRSGDFYYTSLLGYTMETVTRTPTICANCGGETQPGFLLGGDAPMRWVAGAPTFGTSLKAIALGQGLAVGELRLSKGGSVAEGIFCPKCRRVVIEI